MDESDIQKAEAAQITRTFVTLWFQLASASVMLGNFGNVRGRDECNNFGCFCYCVMALERDPTNQKVVV